MITNTMEIPR